MKVHDQRELAQLDGIGPAMLRDLAKLEVTSVAQLAGEDPRELYDRLSAIEGVRMDPCVYDVFCCAVAQARDPELPDDERLWWTWSRRRKVEGPFDL